MNFKKLLKNDVINKQIVRVFFFKFKNWFEIYKNEI